MKSTAFTGKYMALTLLDEFDAVKSIEVSTLSAYAVEYSEFTPPPDLDVGRTLLFHESDYQIIGDSLVFARPCQVLYGGLECCRLVIHHHGIRQYRLLFPQITDILLQERLGRFYEEAETAFDNSAWLSFALMAGAVYEGLLGWRLQKQNDRFSDLIRQSKVQDIISDNDATTLDLARKNRNLIHASRCSEDWMSRARALDMRTVMDRLIRELSVQ